MKNQLYSLILATLFSISCNSEKDKNQVGPSATEIIPVKLITLISETSRQSVEVSGFLSTEDQIRLSFKTGGVLEKVYVKEGDKVNRGQLIASIRPTEINAMAEQASLVLQKAERDYTRVKALYDDSVATLEQMQNVRTALDIARQQVSQARFNQGFIRLTASEDGYVLRKLKNDGELSEPGGPVIILGSLTPKKSWVLHVAVSDKEWTKISIGDSAEITLEAFSDKNFKGFVTKKAAAADPLNGSFSIELEVKMDGSVPATGMFGKAIIKTKYEGKGYWIPYESLIEANGTKASVFVSQDGKKVKRVEVTIDQITKDHVRVLLGLEEFRYLVSSGSPYLRDGSSIQVVK